MSNDLIEEDMRPESLAATGFRVEFRTANHWNLYSAKPTREEAEADLAKLKEAPVRRLMPDDWFRIVERPPLNPSAST